MFNTFQIKDAKVSYIWLVRLLFNAVSAAKAI